MLNAEPYLERCLEALIAQSYPSNSYEILLVDNGSTDRSTEIARRYPAVTLLSEPARGAYNARNRGIAEARGEILAFTDPDCIADRNWLREFARAMEDPSIELAGGLRLPPRATGLAAAIAAYETAKDALVLDGDDEEIVYGFTNNMAVRHRLFELIGGFVDRPRGADTVFARRVAHERSCSAIRFVPLAIVTHLELDTVFVYYKKMFLYARHRVRNKALFRSRSLSFAERMRIFEPGAPPGRVLADPRGRAVRRAGRRIGGLAAWIEQRAIRLIAARRGAAA